MEGAVIKKKKKMVPRDRRESPHVQRRRKRPGMKVRRIQLIIGFVMFILALIVLMLLLNEVSPLLASERIISGNSEQAASLPEVFDRLFQNIRIIFSK